ncbi:MAG: hypothetical protein R3217_07705 [Gammaproteobacteria bacterium]|nr:hypothetical protein [Gammaproteobacteria bacterium]
MANKRLQAFADRIDGLTLRERAAVFVGLVAVIFLAWDVFLLQPLNVESTRIANERALLQQRLVASSQRLQQILTNQSVDPNARMRAELEELGKARVILDERLAERTAKVVSPQDMASVLESVLRKQQGLELVRIESLEAEALFLGTGVDAEIDADSSLGIYRHGLEMRLRGSYLDFLGYVRALEAMDSDFFWEAVRIETDRYPTNDIVLRVYTLSLSEDWIGA